MYRLKEAMYYEATSIKGIVRCLLCPKLCKLKNNEIGTCRTRIAKDNKLYTLAYGNPCAVNADPIEKKPLLHFLPGSRSFSIATAGCNLACLNCQNWTISQKSPLETDNYDLPPATVVKKAQEANCQSIAYTYTEPIVYYEYTLDTAKSAQKAGLKNVFISAGYINPEPLKKLAPYLDAANIDLKSFSNECYKKINNITLKPVLNTLKILKENNVWLEITYLVIPRQNDDLAQIKEMCTWLVENRFENYPLHFSRFYPHYKFPDTPPTPLPTLYKAREIAYKAGMKYVFLGNVSNDDAENTYCPKCKKILINRSYYRLNSFHIDSGKCEYCGEPINGIWKL